MTRRPAGSGAGAGEQLIFEPSTWTSHDGADFFVSPANRQAVDLVGDPSKWPLGRMLLCGPAGSGKSHLATVWAGKFSAAALSSAGLDDRAAELAASSVSALCVEDVHAVAGDGRRERVLLHVMNLAERRSLLLMTARGLPGTWNVANADLASRLSACPRAVMVEPGDDHLAALLAKLFSDRQLACPPNVITYLVRRMERSYSAARVVVERIDRMSLAEKRAITIRLAGRVLDKLARDGA